jgi:hypothetical protein
MRRSYEDPRYELIFQSPVTFSLRWAGHVACMGEKRKVYKVLMGKPEKKRPLGRPRHRWEVGIRMDLREISWGSVDWIELAQDRERWWALVNTVMNLWVLASWI